MSDPVKKTGGNFVGAPYGKTSKHTPHCVKGDSTHSTKVGTSDYSPQDKSTPTPTTYGAHGVSES